MRILSLVAGLLVSASAFAGTTDLTWGEIQNSSKYLVDAPGTFFVYSNPNALGTFYKRFLSLDGEAQVCIAGDQVYGGTVKACVEYATGSDSQQVKCARYETSEIWAPVSGTKKVCTAWAGADDSQCTKYQTINYTISKVAKIWNKNLIDQDQYPAGNKGLVGTKAFSLPACNAQVIPAN